MLTNKSTKQERSNYSNGMHAHSVIKKTKKKLIHFGAQIIAVPWEEELIHSPPVPTKAKGSVVNCVLFYTILHFEFCFTWNNFIKKKFRKNSGTIDMK